MLLLLVTEICRAHVQVESLTQEMHHAVTGTFLVCLVSDSIWNAELLSAAFVAKFDTDAVQCLLMLWNSGESCAAHGDKSVHASSSRFSDLCSAIAQQIRSQSDQSGLDLCMLLANGADPECDWSKGESMLQCLNHVLTQGVRSLPGELSLNLLPVGSCTLFF